MEQHIQLTHHRTETFMLSVDVLVIGCVAGFIDVLMALMRGHS